MRLAACGSAAALAIVRISFCRARMNGAREGTFVPCVAARRLTCCRRMSWWESVREEVIVESVMLLICFTEEGQPNALAEILLEGGKRQ